MKAALDKEKIDYYIKGRPKSIYSIYKKMTSKKIPFEEVYDKFAIPTIFVPTPHALGTGFPLLRVLATKPYISQW